jgi:hypothetical protein
MVRSLNGNLAKLAEMLLKELLSLVSDIKEMGRSTCPVLLNVLELFRPDL